MADIPSTRSIGAFIHCGQCLTERPADISPRDYGRLEIGFTKLGIQVWCRRHECNVAHIDFQGAKHPANTRVAQPAEVVPIKGSAKKGKPS
jgi:hypothetical protein